MAKWHRRVSSLAITPIGDAPAVTEASLQLFEHQCACRLPDDYRRLLLTSNGGFPTPNCITFTEDGHETAADVFCFLAIDEDRAWCSLDWHLEHFADRLPASALPIARDSCGNLWLLSIADKTAGSVYFWDHGSYDTFDETSLDHWPRVATSFEEFRGKLQAYLTEPPNAPVISRYAIVKQANDSLARQGTDFNPRTTPGVWHCDCSDDGEVNLQYVQYEVHAVATHTDGYSRLRAQQGLIEEGPTRLPY